MSGDRDEERAVIRDGRDGCSVDLALSWRGHPLVPTATGGWILGTGRDALRFADDRALIGYLCREGNDSGASR